MTIRLHLIFSDATNGIFENYLLNQPVSALHPALTN